MKFANALFSFFRKPTSRSKEELAFLPAALEIVETPAPPLAGALAGIIIALFCLALAWAAFGKIDIVATSSGKIIPSGRTKVIQPYETGVVRAIHVRDGQAVTTGQVLVELDPTMNDAERKHLESDLITAELDIARLSAAMSQGPDPLSAFKPVETASPMMIAMQREYLTHQVDEHRSKLAALDRQKAQKEAELGTINATVAKLEAVLPVLQQRVDIRKTLFSHETGSKANYLEILQALVETQQDLLVQKSKSKEGEAALAAIIEQRAQTLSEFRRTLSGELVEAQRKVGGLSEDLIKAEQRTKLQLLTAPVDGAVQQLEGRTIGGVVTPAQSLLV